MTGWRAMSFLFPMLRLSLLLSLVGLFVAGCSDTAAPAVDPSAPLVFLTHPTTPPCCWTNAAGQCEGTDVDLARRIAARLARPLVVEAVAFEEIIPRLKAGTADFGIATITITEARRRENAAFQRVLTQLKDRDHRYYHCPKCRQTVRVPRGHGKINIRCPKCGEQFVKKS